MIDKKILIVFVLVISIATPSAFAHKLLAVEPKNTMKEIAIPIPDPSKQSWFTLEEFEREGQSHWYSFIGTKGQEILIQTMVPNIDHSRNFNPSFDLLISDEKVTAIPVSKNYYEPYSKTNWIIKAELKITLPDDGIYYIRAHDQLHHYSIGDVGKFALGIGEKESFSFVENLLIPVWGLQVNLFFGNLMFVWVSLVLAFVLVVIFLVLLMKKDERI